MELKACLFDLDGVLVDTAKYHFQAWRRLAKSIGLDFSEKENEALKGISRMESLRKILDWGNLQLPLEEQERLAYLKNEWYVEMILKMDASELLPGAVTLLEQLRAHQIKIALGSASKNARHILTQTNLLHFFDAVVDGNAVTLSKPDPEVFLTGAKMLNVAASECIVFEDAFAGVQAAKAAAMKVVGVGKVDEIGEADLVVANLAEVTLSELKAMFY